MVDLLYRIATWLLPLMLSLVLSGLVPALIADLLGDRTARERGRLSLNPLVHVDPLGTVLIPLALIAAGGPVIGWTRPFPLDVNRLNNPRLDSVLIGLARPVTNLMLAALGATLLGWLLPGPAQPGSDPFGLFTYHNLLNLVVINVFLMIFNLVPIPPFPGAQIVQGLLPPSIAARFEDIQRYGLLIIVLLFFVLPLLSPQLNIFQQVVSPLVLGVVRLFLASAGVPLD
ncbi:site-2 protease family protein [Nostoc sp. 3335mG]|nr:site-2 protease family protein [Nostoc sp. 3335mG]